jgi:hypothetical protein
MIPPVGAGPAFAAGTSTPAIPSGRHGLRGVVNWTTGFQELTNSRSMGTELLRLRQEEKHPRRRSASCCGEAEEGIEEDLTG